MYEGYSMKIKLICKENPVGQYTVNYGPSFISCAFWYDTLESSKVQRKDVMFLFKER